MLYTVQREQCEAEGLLPRLPPTCSSCDLISRISQTLRAEAKLPFWQLVVRRTIENLSRRGSAFSLPAKSTALFNPTSTIYTSFPFSYPFCQTQALKENIHPWDPRHFLSLAKGARTACMSLFSEYWHPLQVLVVEQITRQSSDSHPQGHGRFYPVADRPRRSHSYAFHTQILAEETAHATTYY